MQTQLAESVRWTGGKQVTRAYAKVIDGVNRLVREDLIQMNLAK